MGTLLQDLKYGLRQLRRNPGFAAVAIVTLALGIGTTTALFTVVRSVLLKPLPFKDPGRLIRIYEHSADGKFPYNSVGGAVFAEWQKESHGFSDLAILQSDRYALSGSGGQLPEVVQAAQCTWNLFLTLGVRPALGRGFTAADDQLSANATAILSWGLWQRRFGGDPAILNHTIILNAKPYTVVGVMPACFAFPDQRVQLWAPIYHESSAQEMQQLGNHEFEAIGRLRPGVSEKQATEELSLIVRRLRNEHRDNPFISDAANSRPLLQSMVGDVETPLYLLLAATGCLLLIACLNVASLMVARGAARRRELAIRSALGGSRWRLLRQHLMETLLLSGGGAAVGLLIAFAVTRWLVAARPDLSRVEAIHMDAWIAAFVLCLIFGSALLASLPSLPSVRDSCILASLQESSRSSAGRGPARLRRSLLALELALTVVLLIGAGLLLKSYARMRSSDLGCISRNVLTMQIHLPEAKYAKGAERGDFFEALLDGVRVLPGVEAAGLAKGVPGEGYMGDTGFTIAEHPPLPLGLAQYAIFRWADPGYFAALGIPMLRGHTFEENQLLKKADEAIINGSFARRYFPGEEPIGKHLIIWGRQWRITGIVGDTRYLIFEPAQPIMYVPVYSGMFVDATLAVRSTQNVTALALPIQRVIQRLDPQLPVSYVLTMNQIIGKTTLGESFNATLLLAFAVLSLTLAAVGLFGVVSYVVTQRTQEIGIRMALGAQKSDVLRLVVGQGIMPALLGLGLGIIASLALTRFLASLLYGVKPTDPLTFVAVSLILIAVALLACYIPARRAAKVDPMVALRYE